MNQEDQQRISELENQVRALEAQIALLINRFNDHVDNP